MNAQTAELHTGTIPQSQSVATLWLSALAVAGLGTWILYDAQPGLNWGLWTAAATAGLIYQRRGRLEGPVIVTGAAAAIISVGAAITTTPPLQLLTCAAVILFLAMQMLLSADPDWTRVKLPFAVTAPFVAFRTAAVESLRRGSESTEAIRSDRARAWIRGLILTTPILIGFALLLSTADPVFAAWREAVARLFSNWEFVPRVVFLVGLLVIVLGAYGYSARRKPVAGTEASAWPPRVLGSIERLMLLGGVAGLFWLFLAVQVSYLFGNLAPVAGSGVTFAEYARRGFAELTVVASATAIIIILSELFGERDGRRTKIRLVTLAAIAAVLILLASAFRRVSLYEAAYGFTIPRLYGQVYMIVVAIGFVLLIREVLSDLDGGRLFRRSLALICVAFLALQYWNHEAWIANRNIDRYAATGKLDTAYLARELSESALPAISQRLASLPAPTRGELRLAIQTRYDRRQDLFQNRWFEWNLRRNRAARVLREDFSLWGTSMPPSRAVGPGQAEITQ